MNKIPILLNLKKQYKILSIEKKHIIQIIIIKRILTFSNKSLNTQNNVYNVENLTK